jgi:hypothetical protein
MEKKAKKSLLAGIPAWALSLITSFVSPFLLVVMGGIGSLIMPNGTSSETIEIMLLSFYPIIIAVACFFICKTHPKSVWYTPIICNAYLIIPAILDSNFWTISFWTKSYWTGTPKIWMFHCAFILSVIGAMIGAMITKRVINQAK